MEHLNLMIIELNILYDFIFCLLSRDKKCIKNSNDKNNSHPMLSAINFIIIIILSNIAIYNNKAIV